MDDTTLRLARTASEITLDRLPDAAVQEAKRRLLDSIACAAGAFDEPFCATIRSFAGRTRDVPGARIWGTGAVGSVEMAGFANGTMVRYLDLSDTFLGRSAGHPSDMIPALVALAEAEGASGARLLEAIVAAYELYCGLCDAVSLQEHALDQSTSAALGAAGGAARLLGLPEGQTANALALSFGANLNLYAVRTGTLSDWKACAGPNAARAGIFAATLARAGVSGPDAVFDGRGGFGRIAGPLDWRLFPAGPPRLVETHLKAHPVCYHGQSAVDAASDLFGRIAPDDVAAVRIEIYDAAVRAMGGDPSRWAPTTRETADHSLPYTVAVTLARGRLTAADYAPEWLGDAGLARLMAVTTVERSEAYTSAYPAQAPVTITVTARDGRVESATRRLPRGHAQDPLSADALAAKLSALWPRRWGAERAARVVELATSLETAPGIAPLVDALCPGE